MPDQTLLDAIASYDLEHHRAPTMRELAAALGTVPSVAHLRVKAAAFAGDIEYEPGIPRSIRIAGARCPACGR